MRFHKLLTLITLLIAAAIHTQSAHADFTILLGDIDGGTGGDAADSVFADPAWVAAVDANTPASDPEVGFDVGGINQNVVFTFLFDIPVGEQIVGATFTTGLRGTAGQVSTDGVFFDLPPVLNTLDNFISYQDLGWDPIPGNTVVIRNTDLANTAGMNLLPLLNDGQFNVLIRDDSLVDFAQLSVTTAAVIPEPATIVGLSAFTAIAAIRRRRRSV